MIRPELLFFVKKKSLIHKLDPRTKLIYAVAMLFLALVSSSLTYLFQLFIISIIPLIFSKLYKELLSILKFISLFAFLVFLFNYIFTFNVDISIAMVLRLLILVFSFLIFSLTTSPDEIVLMLYKLRFPFYLVFSLSLSIRFIPTLMKDAMNIIDAQRSRGLETQKGNLIKRIKNYTPVFIPLLAISINRAINVAEAMESRCFGAVKRPTMFYEIKFSKFDFIFLFLFFIFVFFLIISNFNLHFLNLKI
jgi:ABC-type cobalt transport system, permease component CbiQ and related transporters